MNLINFFSIASPYLLIMTIVWMVYQALYIKWLKEELSYAETSSRKFSSALYLFLRGNNTLEEEEYLIQVAAPMIDEIRESGDKLAGYLNTEEFKK